MRILLLISFFLGSSKLFGEEIVIRPSVWGTDKWYGGFDVYNSRALQIGEAKPSVWGQEKWYGGYNVEFYKYSATTSEQAKMR